MNWRNDAMIVKNGGENIMWMKVLMSLLGLSSFSGSLGSLCSIGFSSSDQAHNKLLLFGRGCLGELIV